MLILWKGNNISLRTLLVCENPVSAKVITPTDFPEIKRSQLIYGSVRWKSGFKILSEIWQTKTKQLHSGLATNRCVHSSESYMEMPNVSCFVHCHLDRLAYRTSVSEWNKYIEKATSFFFVKKYNEFM